MTEDFELTAEVIEYVDPWAMQEELAEAESVEVEEEIAVLVSDDDSFEYVMPKTQLPELAEWPVDTLAYDAPFLVDGVGPNGYNAAGYEYAMKALVAIGMGETAHYDALLNVYLNDGTPLEMTSAEVITLAGM